MFANILELAEFLEQYVSFSIFVLAAVLCVLSVLAWRRERDRRMGVVAAGYGLFAVYGLVGFLEHALAPVFSYQTLELIEHASGVLILAGLLAFFVALIRH